MKFLKNLYNKIKKSIGKVSIKNIGRGLGKAIHKVTTINNSPSQRFTADERKAIDFIKESYKSQNERTKDMYGFTYQADLSSPSSAIYVDNNTKQVYYVIRGTKVWMDKINDLDILSGSEKENSRFNDDLKYYDKLQKIYSDYEIYVLGSSLGGAISNYIGRSRNAKGWAYNSGFGFGSSRDTGQVRNFRNSRDIISLLGSAGNTSIKNIDMDRGEIIANHSTWGL